MTVILNYMRISSNNLGVDEDNFWACIIHQRIYFNIVWPKNYLTGSFVSNHNILASVHNFSIECFTDTAILLTMEKETTTTDHHFFCVYFFLLLFKRGHSHITTIENKAKNKNWKKKQQNFKEYLRILNSAVARYLFWQENIHCMWYNGQHVHGKTRFIIRKKEKNTVRSFDVEVADPFTILYVIAYSPHSLFWQHFAFPMKRK